MNFELFVENYVFNCHFIVFEIKACLSYVKRSPSDAIWDNLTRLSQGIFYNNLNINWLLLIFIFLIRAYFISSSFLLNSRSDSLRRLLTTRIILRLILMNGIKRFCMVFGICIILFTLSTLNIGNFNTTP